MTPSRRAAETAFLAEMLRQDMDRHRKFHLGYTIEEERMWLLFNRCCHPGRKIRLLPRPMRMAVGVPNSFAFRWPKEKLLAKYPNDNNISASDKIVVERV